MVIVAGHLLVATEGRPRYVAECAQVVRLARAAAGCLDFHITADPLEPGRVNVYERWESRSAVERFRQQGPSSEQHAQIHSAHVEEYDVTVGRVLT